MITLHHTQSVAITFAMLRRAVLFTALLLGVAGCGDQVDVIIITETLPNGQVNVAYFVVLEVEGDGDEFLIISGDLPPGISLSGNGELFGTPTLDGTFTVEVLDLSDGIIIDRASKGFAIVIAP